MPDLTARMAKLAAGGPTPSEPFRPATPHSPTAARPKMHRISLDVADGLYQALKDRAWHDRVPMVELIRTVLTDWCQAQGLDT